MFKLRVTFSLECFSLAGSISFEIKRFDVIVLDIPIVSQLTCAASKDSR